MSDTLDICSSVARKVLMETEMMDSKEELEEYYSVLRRNYLKLFAESGDGRDKKVALSTNKIREKLRMLRDIHSTLRHLSGGNVLDDIELFEIKYLALLSEEIRDSVSAIGFEGIAIPQLTEVVSILDPDGLNIRTFYIYDSYSEKLASVRLQMKAGEEAIGTEAFQKLLEESGEEEFKVRRMLCGKLRPFSGLLVKGLYELAALDILIAKLFQIKECSLVIPEISSNGITSYKGMFHPHIKETLEQKGGAFTPIDIEFGIEPVTVVGANMGGKTVVLKMLALNQYLFQFGFGVAAGSAAIDVKDNVFFCIGDEQNILTGLSSFAAEMKQIDNVLDYIYDGRIRSGKNGRVLALVDEPARTTNPEEGRALAESLVDILTGEPLSVLLTTHYNINCADVRRMRVVGLVDGVMDYRLVNAESGDIPHEAINIARSLDINSRWIARAEERLAMENNGK